MDGFALVTITEQYIDDLIGIDGHRILSIMHTINKENDLVQFRLTNDDAINVTIQSLVPMHGYTNELHLAMVTKLKGAAKEATKQLKLLKPPSGK